MTTLSNEELISEIKLGKLLTNTDNEMIEGASYQLRLGNVYYDLSENEKRIELTKDQKVLIKPGHRVVLITSEEFAIPPKIIARVVSKGSLFSIGLSPVATYADPGFKGNLGIVTQNVSDQYIELSQGEPIAKAEFTELSSESTKLYEGQHGFQVGIWPIKKHLQKTYSEIANDERVFSEHKEALALLPKATQLIIRRHENTILWMVVALVIAIMINLAVLYLFITESKFVDYLLNVVVGLIVAGVLSIIGLVVELFKRTK